MLNTVRKLNYVFWITNPILFGLGYKPQTNDYTHMLTSREILISFANKKMQKIVLFFISSLLFSCDNMPKVTISDQYNPCEGIPNCKVYSNGYTKYSMIYDLNIDSLAQLYKVESLKRSNHETEISLIGKKIILIFRNGNGVYKFDFSLQHAIPKEYFPKDFAETDYIVLRISSTNTLGTYSNNRTLANRIDNTIYFINPLTKEILSQKHIEGKLPPEEIRYKHKAPETMSGAPSTKTIINAILNID